MDKTQLAVEEEARKAAAEQAEKDAKAAADKKAEEEANAAKVEYDRIQAENAKLKEERDNYKTAFLKEKSKSGSSIDDLEETEEERVARLVAEQLANSKIRENEKKQQELLERTLKENSELKLAQLNGRKDPPAQVGGHSEGTPVKSTTITPEQERHFRENLKWTDKEIENYKRNLNRKL